MNDKPKWKPEIGDPAIHKTHGGLGEIKAFHDDGKLAQVSSGGSYYVADLVEPRRRTPEWAEANGYTVDRHCYPHFAYKGPRFKPDQSFQVVTDREAVLIDLLKECQPFLEKVGADDPDFSAVATLTNKIKFSVKTASNPDL